MQTNKLTHLLCILHQFLIAFPLVSEIAFLFSSGDSSALLLFSAGSVLLVSVVSYIAAWKAPNFAVYLIAHILAGLALCICMPVAIRYGSLVILTIYFAIHLAESNHPDKQPILAPNVGYILIYIVLYFLNRYAYVNTVLYRALIYSAAADILVFCLYSYQTKMNQFMHNQKQASCGYRFPETSIRKNGLMMVMLLLALMAFLMILLPLRGIDFLTSHLQTGLIGLLSLIFSHLHFSEADGVQTITQEPYVAETEEAFEAVAAEGATVPQWVNTTIYVVLSVITLIALSIAAALIVYGIYCLIRGFMGFSPKQEEEEEYTEVVENLRPVKNEARHKAKQDTGSPSQVIRKLYRHVIRSHTKKKMYPSASATPAEAENAVGLEDSPDRAELHRLYEKARYGKQGADYGDAETVKSIVRKKL